MESIKGHTPYELHPTGTHLVERPTEAPIATTDSEVYVLRDDVTEYEARCSCGERFSSWEAATQHANGNDHPQY
ncbi:hypothetical protein ACFQJ5_14730 [Halomicroarcula sp. GCM10025324]